MISLYAGAVFAASNAAIMLAQLGDERGAVAEMQRIARRAPGSADMRAALAALYWSQARGLSLLRARRCSSAATDQRVAPASACS